MRSPWDGIVFHETTQSFNCGFSTWVADLLVHLLWVTWFQVSPVYGTKKRFCPGDSTSRGLQSLQHRYWMFWLELLQRCLVLLSKMFLPVWNVESCHIIFYITIYLFFSCFLNFQIRANINFKLNTTGCYSVILWYSPFLKTTLSQKFETTCLGLNIWHLEK